MKSTIERMKIPVHVHPVIREYLIDTNGTDVIVPRKGDLVWAILKQNLETIPADYAEPIDTDNLIYIELLDCHNTECYSESVGKFLHINTLFRWHLSARGQNKINNILRANFKASMHSFIQGAVACNPELEQREAMQIYCDTHNLTMGKITSDMIKKSWDRSRHKLKVMDKSVKLNTIFF